MNVTYENTTDGKVRVLVQLGGEDHSLTEHEAARLYESIGRVMRELEDIRRNEWRTVAIPDRQSLADARKADPEEP